MQELSIPVDLIWGEHDPWEPIAEAKRWAQMLDCVQSLSVVHNAGPCPHAEAPDQVNPVLHRLTTAGSTQQAP